MKIRTCVGALLTAALFLSTPGSQESQAYGWRGYYGYRPNYSYSYPSQMSGGMSVPYYGYAGMQVTGYGYTMPSYNPYVAPYPAYGILPPDHTYGYGQSWYGADRTNPYGSTRKTAEDYGYPRESFEQPPRKRSSLYPAIPFPIAAAATPVSRESEFDATADERRARLRVTLPKADAAVFIDDQPTRQSGMNRVFVTPPLQYDKNYYMTIEARWTDDTGKLQRETRTIEFVLFPNQRIQKDIDFTTRPIVVPPVVPTTTGYRVLIVYERDELGRLTAGQGNILFSVKPDGVRAYLARKTKEFRIYDKDVKLVEESAFIRDAMNLKRTSLPWIVIGEGERMVYEGALPSTVEATLELLKLHMGD